MTYTEPSRDLWKRRTISVLYVAIAMALVAQAAAATQTYVNWFETLSLLAVELDHVVILSYDSSFEAIVVATLRNPTDFGKVMIQSVTYRVFLNSTTQNFFVSAEFQLESEAGEFGYKTGSYNGMFIPARDSLNMTLTVQAHEDVVTSLRSFLDAHTVEDLRFFVSMTMAVRSYYGYLTIPSCQKLPGREHTICPTPRSAL